MSLRSGATRGPLPLTRWQAAQSAFPSKSALPFTMSLRGTSPPAPARPEAGARLRRYATIVPAWVSEKLLGGIVVPGIPVWMIRMISVSVDPRRNWPRMRSMPGTMSPVGP